MSPYPLFTISQHDKPEQIEKRIGMIIRLYLQDHNQVLATAVEEHIKAILAHPGYITDIERRCLFRRLAAHWRCLAWVSNETSEMAPIPSNERK